MSLSNESCGSSIEDLRSYQHHVYAVVYSVILAPGLLGNVLALWVFQAYVRETKRGVVFMMNLAVADLLQVLSLPLRIYYYLNHTWPFGRPLCMLCFYLKYVNMYASIFFLVCVSVRRCELIIHPLRYHSNRRRGDGCVCAAGWLLVCLGCLPFPLLRNASSDPTTPNPYTLTPDLYTDTAPYDLNPNPYASSPSSYAPAPAPTSSPTPTPGPTSIPAAVCFAELPMREVSPAAGWTLMVVAELVGFILPLVLVLTCACLSAGSLRVHMGEGAGEGVKDQGEKRRALRMVLSCAGVFLLCFSPYHVTMPLDFLAKADALGSCGVREMVLRCHPVTLCLASLNSGLDPLMYYFTTDEFRRRFSRPEIPESFSLAPRLSCTSGGGSKDLPLTPEPDL
ncbi:probable G-protein coupled receptor 174 [Coregonus clupeaformis]|uniref:probable G-protein coupled receptor 174 n=1 Tax=Coregonus clupeaformis TaxID=59861 RepID=UPI001E1C45F2|nr:probable G-protein coupled receptor 174 [Coregonus clupeaformis]